MMDIMVATSMAEERARRYREYVEALEEERRKIQVFQRELPLSLHLVTQTIENCRQAMAADLMTAGASGDPSELDEEETSTEGGPVLEEFIPIKRSCSSQAEDEEGDRRHHRPCQDAEKTSNGRHHDDDCYSTSKPKQQVEPEKKPDWLRSVQLWCRQPDPQPAPMEEDDVAPRRPIVVEAKKPTGAFQPFNPQRRSPALAAAPAEIAPVAAAPAPSVPPASSSSETRGAEKGGAGVVVDEKDGNTHRKARRCWSPELHRRFLDALQRLGGSHVGTPKQIRELMKVDGLTNDEVKSHLQKYRLHSRRPSPTSQSSAGSPTPQQIVFLGGIWVPPPEYAAAAAAAGPRSSAAEGVVLSPVYAPIASVPPPAQQQGHRSPTATGPLPTGGSGSRDEQGSADDATRSNSPATSSSSHTTTTSPSPRC